MARFGFRRSTVNTLRTEQPLLRNSEQPLHIVTHRAIGDIPGCIPAPRSSTWVNSTPEECRAITAKHADAFCKAIEDGTYKTFSFPMFGVYGEKL